MFKIKTTQKFTLNLKLVNSSAFPDCNPRCNFPWKIKPDVSIYPPDVPDAKTNSAIAEIFAEFKWNSTDNPFCDPITITCPSCNRQHQSFVRNTNAALDTLGQITSYAAAQLGAQFRTHAYSILIVKDSARIIRWDRSGAIVTEAIKYNESPHLAYFFWHYSRAPPTIRGKDETVNPASTDEMHEARKFAGFDAGVPLVKLSIPTTNSLLYVIVPIPEAPLYTPPGRCTRGFKAYDMLNERVVFLKDTWRIDLPEINPEGKIYAILNTAKVRNVPQCLASGDVSTTDHHATKTYLYTTANWQSNGCPNKSCRSKLQFIPHRHYRIVMDVVGRSLADYNSSYEMVAAVRDALIGELLGVH